jgi:hypothetical protein
MAGWLCALLLALGLMVAAWGLLVLLAPVASRLGCSAT